MKKFTFIFGLLIAVLVMSGFLIKIPKVSAGSPPNWFDGHWSYRKTITINHANISTGQSDFPVLINITDTDLKNHALSTGYDIFFTDGDGNQIPYEREQFTKSTGTLVAWVQVPTLSSSDDAAIYMYYGNPATGDQQQAANVWDGDFKGVWHLNDAGNSTVLDSTANHNDGTNNGAAVALGQMGGAGSFDGSDNYISIVPISPDALSGSFTVSAWAKVPDDENTYTVIGSRSPNDGSFDFKFDTGDIIHGDIGDGSDFITTEADATGFTYAIDTWYQITYAITPTSYTIYINGNELASGNYDESTPLFFDPDHNIFIGQAGGDTEYFNGVIDEVRVSDIARSADWIQTEYNNENSPSTFYSLASEEPVPVYTLTYTAGANGSVTGTSPQTVNYGADGTAVTAVPAVGYHFVDWSDASISNPRTDTTVTADISVTANFAIDVSRGGGGGGSIYLLYPSVVPIPGLPNTGAVNTSNIAAINATKQQLISLITQLIKQLQAQLSAMIASGQK
jgi:hypothetical protein